MTNYSPLRYPGGKGKLAPYFAELLSLNDLEGGHYAEPFAGGAAVALDLLFSERVKHIHINDIDCCVHSFWNAAVYQTEALVDKIYSTPVTVESWLEAREVKRNPTEYDNFEVGFATFFLNRCNRSGILNGGIIGGLSQEGQWKIDARYNKDELAFRLRRIGLYRSRITIKNLDALEFIGTYLASVPQRTLIYIDPPYYVKGAYLYQNHFQHEDHVRLAEAIRNIERHTWVVSYDNVEQIRRIYSGWDQEQFTIGYSARSYGKGAEVMVFGPGVKRPERVFSSKMERKAMAG